MFAKMMIALILAFSVAGCATYKESYETTTLVDKRTGSISNDAAFLVATEGDGRYIDKTYQGSGGMARVAMVSALSKYASNVAEIPSAVPEDAATLSAIDQNVAYLVYLRLLHWEDRATEWTGKPDRIEVEIRLIDGKSGDVLESRIVKANSKWATLGGDHPQDLLVGPFDEYSASIFGRAPGTS